MAVKMQELGERHALYCGDAVEILPSLSADSVHLSIYSPPFAGLYHYSSSEHDLSNCDSYAQFFEHYAYVVEQVARLTLSGRMTLVHCADVPSGNTGVDHLIDLPGDIIRLHQRFGFDYVARYCVWKEPLGVRNRTMMKSLNHSTIVEDSSRCANASADYVLGFRRHGENKEPIQHPTGLEDYAGSRQPPSNVMHCRKWSGNQIENRYSHWVWRQYASAFWDDVRKRVLPYRAAREEEDEKHVHPLQLDIIDRCLTLWSNPNDVVLSPFAGIGSEVYGALSMGRRAVGIELKSSYYRQMVKNVRRVGTVTLQSNSSFVDDEIAPTGLLAEL